MTTGKQLKKGKHESFCTAYVCIDGRVQKAIRTWCRRNLRVDHADTITIAGCDGILLSDETELQRAIKLGRISVEKHHSTSAVVEGHSECAGYSVSEGEHREAIKQAVQVVANMKATDGGKLFTGVVAGLFFNVKTRKISEVYRI